MTDTAAELAPQGSVEWRLARVGKVTASRVADVVRSVKSGGYASSRANYMAELTCERLTGAPTQGFVNGAMQWGTDQEPNARSAYELREGVWVEQTGFIDHRTIQMTGASPDGLIGDVGMIEIKCPNTATHIDMLMNGKIDQDYIIQMQWEMLCADRLWCDFISYDPRLPERMRLFVHRVHCDYKMSMSLTKEVMKFLDDLDARMRWLRANFGEAT